MRTTTLCFLMAVCAWGGYFYGNAFYMVALVDAHGWSVTQISSAITLGFWTAIPASLVVGWTFDLHGRRWGALCVVGYGALAMGGGIASLARVDALWQLYLAYMLMGSAYPALAAPAISATLHQRASRRYGLELGLALTGASVGGAIAAPALLWATARYGFPATLTALGCLIPVALLPVAGWVLRPVRAAGAASVEPSSAPLPAAPDAGAGVAVREALRSRAFWTIVSVGFLTLAAQVGFLAHQFSVLSLELPSATAAFAVSATAASSAVGRLLVGGLSSRVSLRHLAALTYGVMALGILIVALGDGPVVIVAGCIVAGLFVGAVVLLPPMLCRAYFETAIYGRVYGFIAIGVYAGAGIGPSIAGVVRDATGEARVALLCLAGLSAAAVILVERLREHRGGRAAHSPG